MNFITAGIPIGRWFGVRVTISWLFLIFFAFQAFTSDPVQTAQIYAILFGIVLLHEFGHCFACRLMKGRADHIVLWPFGGLAFVDPPPKPMAHLVSTIGGPLVNVLLIVPLWAALHFLPENLPPIVFTLLEYASMINFLLLIFNLFPIYPMDGGRIFQEILWFFVGYDRALLVAGMVGTVGGAAMIVMGLHLFPEHFPGVLGTLFNQGDMWLAAIGFMAAFESFRAYQIAQQRLSFRR